MAPSRSKYTVHPPYHIREKIRQEKQRKLQQRREVEDATKVDFLQQLPLELLVEILSYSSVMTVLSVTRCCKWLCHTLTHPDQAFVWKGARQRNTVGPIPDPPATFTESAYAAILFDGGQCENCKAHIRDVPLFFYHRVFICSAEVCSSRKCLQKHFIPLREVAISDEEGGGIATTYALTAFSPHPMDSSVLPSLYLVDGSNIPVSIFRRERETSLREWSETEEDPDARQALIKKWEARTKSMPSFYKHEREYRPWVQLWRTLREVRKQDVDQGWRDLMSRNGWSEADTRASATLKTLRKVLKRENEPWDPRRHELNQIAAEVHVISEARQRRSSEYHRALRQKAIEAQWVMLKNQPLPNTVIPRLAIFRRLPTVHALEKNEAITTDMEYKLKNDAVLKAMLHADLEAWEKTTRRALTAKLGFKRSWEKAANLDPAAIHPLDRPTALFECMLCHRTGREFSQAGALKYRGVVKHRCPHYVKRQRRKKERRDWELGDFEPDTVAIKAVTLALQVAGIDDQVAQQDEPGTPKGVWICLSCPKPSSVTLTLECTAGHAKRHKALAVAATSGRPASPLTSASPAPFSFSLRYLPWSDNLAHCSLPYPDTEELMSNAPSAVKKRGLKEYACRHCESDVVARINQPPDSSADDQKKGPPLFTVDGLISHLKSKHGVVPLRGEDFYSWPPSPPPDNAH